MESVPDGFSRRQGTDICVISKYARLYLKSLFKHVYTVKGIATSDFRKIWGIQKVYSKKERVNHVHHCIDAIVIACIGLDEYNKLGTYYHDEEIMNGMACQRLILKSLGLHLLRILKGCKMRFWFIIILQTICQSKDAAEFFLM